MDICMLPAQMGYFLDLTGLRFTMEAWGVLVHANQGDVSYLWNGVSFCFGGGNPA